MMTGGQGVTGRDKGLQGMASNSRDDKRLQRVTRGYTGLHMMTRDDKGLH